MNIELEMAINFLKSRAISTEKIKNPTMNRLVSVIAISEVETVLEMVQQGNFSQYLNELHEKGVLRKSDFLPPFKISRSWDCIKSIEELIADAKFIFNHNGHKGKRPRIVLNTPIDGYDCIEIDYDRYGLITNGVQNFDSNLGETITDSSKDCIGFIRKFLIWEGVQDFILTIK